MKKPLLLLLFMFYITLKLLSQENTRIPLIDTKCFPELIKHTIKDGKWNIDNPYAIQDSTCLNYLSSINLNTVGDTLLITLDSYSNGDNLNFVGVKIILDSDSSATAYLYMDNYLILMKGKSARKMKKERIKNLEPIIFKVFIKEDSSCVLSF